MVSRHRATVVVGLLAELFVDVLSCHCSIFYLSVVVSVNQIFISGHLLQQSFNHSGRCSTVITRRIGLARVITHWEVAKFEDVNDSDESERRFVETKIDLVFMSVMMVGLP